MSPDPSLYGCRPEPPEEVESQHPGESPYPILWYLAQVQPIPVAAAGNAGKIALYGGNPLALNIAQWAMLARRVVQRTQIQSISETLVNQHTANTATIHTGWAKLGLDVSEPIDA